MCLASSSSRPSFRVCWPRSATCSRSASTSRSIPTGRARATGPSAVRTHDSTIEAAGWCAPEIQRVSCRRVAQRGTTKTWSNQSVGLRRGSRCRAIPQATASPIPRAIDAPSRPGRPLRAPRTRRAMPRPAKSEVPRMARAQG